MKPIFIADIKGKLSMNEYVSEDFLTSSVFSVFNYLNPKWITQFLNLAVNRDGRSLDIEVTNPDYDFWPWFNSVGKSGKGAEPDLVIYTRNTAIIIEAKNYAGKSGEGVMVKDNQDIIVDQLGREYFVGQNSIMNSIRVYPDGERCKITKVVLIFLTRHSCFPKEDIDQSLDAIGQINIAHKNNARANIFWLNWQKAVPVLEEVIASATKGSFERKISSELLQFLNRREINCFNGFNFLDNFQNAFVGHVGQRIFYHDIDMPYWMGISDSSLILQDELGKFIFYNSSPSK